MGEPYVKYEKVINNLLLVSVISMFTTLAMTGLFVASILTEPVETQYTYISNPTRIPEVRVIVIKENEEEVEVLENVRGFENEEPEIKEQTESQTQQKNEEKDIPLHSMIEEVAGKYGVDANIIKAIVERESRNQPTAKNGQYIGLMQVSQKWHKNRMDKLGVTDLIDPYSNLMVGTDYFSELMNKYDNNTTLALMCYSMGEADAVPMYEAGKETTYAKDIIRRAIEIGGRNGTG